MKILQKKLFLFTLVAFSFFSIYSQTWNEVQKIVASDRAGEELFGSCVSISGDYAIVGAIWNGTDSSGLNFKYDAGAAYIFERDGIGNWNEAQKIVASDRDVGDIFGWSVSISGDYAIVSACYEDEDTSGGNTLSRAGAAYIFERDISGNWNEVQKIVAFDRAMDDQFGQVVSISGNYVVVAVCYEDHDSSGGNYMKSAGSAYIFERDGIGNWNEVQKIVASDRDVNDIFGWSVSISGDYIILGAVQEDDDASGGDLLFNAGSAYIFERDGGGTWNEVQKIVNSDREIEDWFGSSVSVSGDYAIVGAYGEDHDSSGGNYMESAGSAYIFERDAGGTWNEVQKIVASDRDSLDRFAKDLAISGNSAIVRSQNDKDASGGNPMPNSGSAYIFTRDGIGNWYEVQKIVASDRDSLTGCFGWPVSISGNYVIAAAPYEDKDASAGNPLVDAGAAYIFETSTVGIYENDFGASLNVYPNPTTGKLSIDLGQEYNEVDISVMNLIGQVIYTRKFEITDLISLEIEGSSGLYMVKINTTDGKSATLRVLKK